MNEDKPGAALPPIDSEVTVDERTYVVVDHDPPNWFVVRMDINGDDAAYHTGECNVDWEYVHIRAEDASW